MQSKWKKKIAVMMIAVLFFQAAEVSGRRRTVPRNGSSDIPDTDRPRDILITKQHFTLRSRWKKKTNGRSLLISNQTAILAMSVR